MDAVVICYAHEIDALKDEISKKVQCPVVGLGEVLFGT